MISTSHCEVEWAAERLLLTSARALVWPAQRTALVADLHLGKEAVFRRHGLAVPDGPTGQTLSRLSAVVREYQCSRLLVLGDFMHAAPAKKDAWPERVSEWIDGHPGVTIDIVSGNHDREYGRKRLDPRLRWHTDNLSAGPFELSHEPAAAKRGFLICGHLHPVIRTRVGRERLRSPVFWYRGDSAVLPAFGQFTGGHAIGPAAEDRVWLVDQGAIVELPGHSRTQR